MELNKKSIIFVFDPFCSWCYAMTDVIRKIQADYNQDFDFVAMAGGMVLNENTGKIKEKFDFLENGIKRVEQHTGIVFGPNFKNNILKEGEYVIDSLEPSKAIRVFKSLDESNQTINFIHKLQEKFYFDGLDIRNIDTILDLVNDFDIDTLEYRLRFEDENYSNLTQIEFNTVKSWGISGYPTLLYKNNEQLYLISSGYQYYMDLKNIMNQIKSQN